MDYLLSIEQLRHDKNAWDYWVLFRLAVMVAPREPAVGSLAIPRNLGEAIDVQVLSL